VPPAEDEPGDPETVARTICLRLLTQRARTRSELAKALSRRGVPGEVADRVLIRFVEVGLIDDAAVAQSFAVSQHRDRALSARAVAARLRERGIPEHLVQSAIGEIDADSEASTAARLAQRKLQSLRNADPATRRRRVYGMLLRRGYAADLATRVVAETVGQDDTVHGTEP
jgi:regulatory protein